MRWHVHPQGAHLGARRLLSVMSKRFTLPRGYEVLRRLCTSCAACAQRKPTLRKIGLLASSAPIEPWETVAVDFAGPYPASRSGARYILVFTDHFTKWVELVPTANQFAATVAKAFYERIICRFGAPRRLLSDNDASFKNALIETLCSEFGVRKIFSSVYYPQGDGFAERMIRTLNNSLAALTATDGARWDDYLPGIAFAYNTTRHSATREAPFDLNFGRAARLVGEQTYQAASPAWSSEANFARRLRNVITAAQHRARAAVQRYWTRMKESYDCRRLDMAFLPGDSVLVALTDKERSAFPIRKLAPRWSGVATIEEVLPNRVTYRIRKADGTLAVLHGSRLLPLKYPLWGKGFPAPCARQQSPPKYHDNRNSKVDEGEDEVLYLWPRTAPRRSAPSPSQISEDGGRAGARLNGSSLATDADYDVVVAVERQSPGSSRSLWGSNRDDSPLEPEFEVERLVGKRCRQGVLFYRVKWVGFSQTTWEPAEMLLQDIPTLVEDYERQCRRTNE